MYNISERYEFKTTKSKCQLAEGKIVEVLSPVTGKVDRKEYKPFEINNLYLEFASVDYNDPNEILKFVEEYGFPYSPLGDGPHHMTLNVLSEEIKKIKSIIETWSIVKEGSLEVKRERLNIIEGPNSYKALEYFWKNQASSQEGWLNMAIDAVLLQRIRNGVQELLNHVHPMLNYTFTKNGEKCTGFTLDWFVPDLLSAMYIMMSQDMSVNKSFRKCQNESCSRYFQLNDDYRKIYCDNSCAKAQAQREYRRRKKIKESGKNGR